MSLELARAGSDNRSYAEVYLDSSRATSLQTDS